MLMRKARRSKAKIKLGISGPSGAGKTYASLLIAYGLCGDWEKVCIIDTENGSADLYEHLGPYNVITLYDFSPESFVRAIKAAEDAGMMVIIIDSATHEWEFCVDFHASLPGNSFANWAKVTPRHDAFRNAILRSPCHVISTTRRKQDYVINTSNGKNAVEKLGTKEVQRDGWEYDLTLNFEVNMSHLSIASKDRTRVFSDGIPFTISEETGRKIREWCESGSETASAETLLEQAQQEINDCTTVAELGAVYGSYPMLQKNEDFVKSLTVRKQIILEKQ